MTDFDADTLSTVIDTDAAPSASGGGTPPISDPVEDKAPKEPLSLRDELSKAFKDDAEKAAPKPKAEVEPKVEKAPETEPAKTEGEGDQKDAKATEGDADRDGTDKAATATEAKPEEKGDGGKFQEPPKKFLPDAREHWRNVPRSVRRDIDTMVREHEETATRYKVANDRYETIRDYDELARSNGRELRDSLARVHEVENLIQRNPIAGINQILMEVGPRKADGQPVSLFEMAQFIVEKGPQGYQQMVAQAPQAQQRPVEDPRVSQLQQQLQQMQEQTLAMQVIEPFKVEHPRYAELQDDIAFFLQSGKISQSLSPYDRLAAAYDMAVRINPASHVESSARVDEGPDPERRAGEDFSGPKSIKSSPGSVTEIVDDKGKGDESVAESIRAEMRRLNRK